MNLKIIQSSHHQLAELLGNGLLLPEVQDAVDLLGNCRYQGIYRIIIRQEQLTPGFFDLKTGIAGEILQKFSNYNVRLAIIGNYEMYTSQSLREFMAESNRQGRINFVATIQEAIERLIK